MYEDRLKEMNLTTLKQRKERDQLILFKFVNKFGEVDRDNLFLTVRMQGLRKHGMKLNKRT